MYNRILVPLDGSEFSECSLEHARAIARGDRVPEVILLRIIEPQPQFYMARKVGGDLLRKATEMNIADANSYLSKLADRLRKDGVNVKTAVVLGEPADRILDYAEKNGIDLIVMSTHGRSGVSRFAFGSVAEKVIRTSAIPVLSLSPSGCRVALQA